MRKMNTLNQRNNPSSASPARRRNVEEKQVISPQKVDLTLKKDTIDEIAVPASINGNSLADGRP